MAYSDIKSSKPSGGGRISYGRSETQAERDARARAYSKDVLDGIKRLSDPCGYLVGLDSVSLYRVYSVTHQITSYGKYDWERILDLLGDECKEKVKEALEKAKADVQQQRQEQQAKRNAEYEHQQLIWAEQAKAREQAEYETKMEIVNSADLMLGSLQSETSQVFQKRERHELDFGDWLDSPVDSRLKAGGWSEETYRQAGFKLQISVSLDVSNSMWYNKIAQPAIRAFQELALAVRALQSEYPDSVEYSVWLFSQNRDGKGVDRLSATESNWNREQGGFVTSETDDPLKETRKLFQQTYIPSYAGEDTYLSSLLEQLKSWEDREVGDGYVKLDIILSDAVFERKVDISRSDDIQASRGQVHTVILNFIPEDDWFDGRLPYQTVQYPVTADNINGMLRMVLQHFLEVYI